MKKLLVLSLTVLMVIAFGAAAMASTMGVNVSEGMSVGFEYYTQEGYSNGPWFNFDYGVSDNFKFNVAYELEGNDKKGPGLYNLATTSVGARYEIVENVAATFNYDTADADNNALTLGIRGKMPFSDTLAATGKVEYVSGKDTGTSYTAYQLYPQVEFEASKGLFLTAGYFYKSTEYDGYDAYGRNGYIVGAEYAVDKLDFYVDYKKTNVDSNKALTTFGFAYSF